MLRSMEDLEGYAVAATDGVVGHVKDLYFEGEDLGSVSDLVTSPKTGKISYLIVGRRRNL